MNYGIESSHTDWHSQLINAIDKRETDIALCLLSTPNVDVNFSHRFSKRNPLVSAAQCNVVPVVEKLISLGALDFRDGFGMNAFNAACLSANLDLMVYFFDMKFERETENFDSLTYFAQLNTYSDCESHIDFLLEIGAKIWCGRASPISVFMTKGHGQTSQILRDKMYAAGVFVEMKYLSKFVGEENEEISLAKICRNFVRKETLKTNLFHDIERLPIPRRLKSFLTFNVTIGNWRENLVREDLSNFCVHDKVPLTNLTDTDTLSK